MVGPGTASNHRTTPAGPGALRAEGRFSQDREPYPGQKAHQPPRQLRCFPEGEWADRDKTAYRYFIPWVEFAREHGSASTSTPPASPTPW